MSQSMTTGPVAERFLTFVLGSEEYGVSIRCVQEIIGILPTTPVPGTPSYVTGVVNLRGAIVPVIDLRRRFGMREAELTREACIIVTRSTGATVGLLADRVCDVVSVSPDAIQHPQTFGSSAHAQFVTGIAAHQKGARILLDASAITSDAAANGGPAHVAA
ncbi:MAG: chemotaxis protein CheW [Sandaracinaceae bacterium]|nr:chemotaxis protein CheW [Sandaracinaceae bacterium]